MKLAIAVLGVLMMATACYVYVNWAVRHPTVEDAVFAQDLKGYQDYASKSPAKKPNCEAIKEKAAPKGCTELEGGGAHCEMGDMPPMSWGRCIESPDQNFYCEKGGSISRYGKEGEPLWTTPDASCKALHEQIERHGQGGERIMTVPIPSLEEADTSPKI